MLAVVSLCQVQWHMQQHVQKHFKGLSSSTVPYVARRRGKAWSRDSFGDTTANLSRVRCSSSGPSVQEQAAALKHP